MLGDMRFLQTWLVVGLCVFAAGIHAAAPAQPAAGTAMSHALALYEKGQLAAARGAFEKLSELGIPAADYNLAVMHLKGEMDGATVQDAVRLMTRAAARGFVTAMVGLAQLHERGQIDGKRDLAAAHEWQLKAAQAGSVDAQVEAATGYYLGRGTAKDMAAAAQWYREAAKRGDAGAQYLIASMYEQGLGVPRDLRLARHWYEACAQSGDVAAPGKLREVEAKLAAESQD